MKLLPKSINELENILKDKSIDILKNQLYDYLIDVFFYKCVEIYNNELTLLVENEAILDYLNINFEYFKEETKTLYFNIYYDGKLKLGSIINFDFDFNKNPMDLFQKREDFESNLAYKIYLVEQIQSTYR